MILYSCQPSCYLHRHHSEEDAGCGAQGSPPRRIAYGISNRFIMNPNNPDAEYRSKAGKKVKGYSTNITETCDEEGKTSLITNDDMEGAMTADNTTLQAQAAGGSPLCMDQCAPTPAV